MANYVKGKIDSYQVLVVENIVAHLRFLTDILCNQGYHVRPAINGKLALRSVMAELRY